MAGEKIWYVRLEDGKAYGPADVATLVKWAEDGRIGPTASLSQDRKSWESVLSMPELGMDWLVEIAPGEVFGPFNRAVVINLSHREALGEIMRVYRRHTCAVDQDPPPVEKIVEKEVIKEVPVEVIKEVKVEVPVEKIVEKIVEKEVVKEVPVEVIKEVKVEVPVPDRVEVVEAEVIEPVAAEPARPKPAPHPASAPNPFGGAFRGGGRNSLAALEAALQRELAAANKRKKGFGFFGGK